MKKLAITLFYASIVFTTAAQELNRPKLVVGIVVDQMRYDYLSRYWKDYEEEGFKRLVREGFSCRNMHYNYAPTVTGPGHASAFTGTTPQHHGIIANAWFDRESKRTVYCSSDPSVRSVGQATPKGQMSPANMLATTMCDELELNTAGKSKVIGVAMKDRGATLTAGHLADGAYWMTDRWITSTHYRDTLPDWVIDFNQSIDQWVPDQWETLKPIDDYDESWADENNYEYAYNGREQATFPYDLKALMPANGGMGMIKSTPFGNTITVEFAKAAIVNEQMGQDAETDFLTLSFSSTDYMGHMYGPQAVEVQDCYLRLDRELAGFLSFLDEKVGVGEYLLFLTADHGGAWVPAQMNDLKVPAGYIDGEFLSAATEAFLTERYNASDLLLNYSNEQFFLDRERIFERGHDPDEVAQSLAGFVMKLEGVAVAYTAHEIKSANQSEGPLGRLHRGYNPKRSGDVLLLFEPGWMEYGMRGTTHGSPYGYDTHVPGLFFGWGIETGYTDRQLAITDIAPTVSALLQIGFPNACSGHPIRQITER